MTHFITSMSAIRRNLSLLGIMAVTAASTWAAPVDESQAADMAAEFLNTNPTSIRRAPSSGASLSLAYKATDGKTPLFYIFNDADGFVIVSADDKFPAVLGYSDSGIFDEAKIPVNMKAWLDGYAAEMTHYLPVLPDGFGSITKQNRISRAPISPMVTTKWNQDTPYNLLCPTDKYGQAVTGCVATAYAQIMNFHKWPTQPVGENGGITFTGTTYNWRQMLDDYQPGTYTGSQATAVATLMRQCGAAVNMRYSAWASGAYSHQVPTALTRYFKYDPGLTMYWKDYIPQSRWNDIVYQELAQGRPVYYSGSSSEGGHAFVCDGYSDNEYFHFNWGWGGYEDGYYRLTALNPASGGIGSYEDGYTSNQSIIIGIKPGTESSEPTQTGLLASGGFYHKSGLTFEVREGQTENLIYNPFDYTINVQMGIKIVAADNAADITYKECGSATDLASMYGFMEMTTGSLPALPDGKYKVYPVYRCPKTSSNWLELPVPIGMQNYVDLTLSKGNPTFTNSGPDSSNTPKLIFGTPETVDVLYGDLPVALRIPVVNVGQGDFSSQLGFSLMDAEDDFGGAASVMDTYIIPAGSSSNIDVSFNSELPAGTYILSVMDMTGNIFIDNYKLTLKETDLPALGNSIKASALSPNFFTEGKDSPLYFTVSNPSFASQTMDFTFEILDSNSLLPIKTLPVNYSVTVPGNYTGRINVRPTDLEVEPGVYYWRVKDSEGQNISAPAPMIVNSEVKMKDGIAYVETSRSRKEALIVAPESNPYIGNIIIPESIDGLKVKGLRNNAFTFASTPEVSLPANITKLDPGTFYCNTALNNFFSESKQIIPYQDQIFASPLRNIWLNVSQDIVGEWHSQAGWRGMQTPYWMMKLDGVEITSGMDIDTSTSEPIPYRMNFATPLSLTFSAPEGKNVEILMIVDRVWILNATVDPKTYTLEVPALGLNTTGEIRLTATTAPLGVEGVESDPDSIFDLFSIDGRLILRNATKQDLKNLPSGLYFSKGQKILIK